MPPGCRVVRGALTLSSALRRGETVSHCPFDVDVCCLPFVSSYESRAMLHVLVGCTEGGGSVSVGVVTVTAVVVFPS